MPLDNRTFGGHWTQEKLEMIRKYLCAYTRIMSKQPYKFHYIDAFAGTGYNRLRGRDHTSEPLFPEFAEPEQHFLKGSARIALDTEPSFTSYVFVERDPHRVAELEQVKIDYPQRGNQIRIRQGDANAYLCNWCESIDWKRHRAVLFLDPFGMQVPWTTIEAIAQTEAIDLWLLFPLGVAINRLLRRDGNIDSAIRQRLDAMFGEPYWYDMFYAPDPQAHLFDDAARKHKVANFPKIGDYFVQRLKTKFPGVAENPRRLYNSTNNPLYLLCFAASNKAGAPTAIRIAQDILGR